ncbi:uncharacterized protein LOC133036797 [Cannabis sativa]|uniref:uncharacterized protein LOC133036797 n=1 Tax=Cannabis sativa TaxID=3483 RepID=UPI0029CA5468|nr:uncharacterized protein LOC133036797 [Cannabis sativa]
MKYLTTATFKFNLNGHSLGHVVPSRGIRQGNPLSPYLFLLCSKGLSSILKHDELTKDAFGLKLTRTAPKISHLLFADDSLLFCRSNIQACNAIKEALAQYQNTSGQLIKKSFLQPPQERNLVLSVKMASFVEKEMANFWWGAKDGERKLHWKYWRSLCNSKSIGGLGFRSLKPFNKAMLAKQAWRIQTNQSSFLATLFKAKYFPRSTFLESSLGHSPSYVWQSLHWGKSLLKVGLCKRIGNGDTTKILEDYWILNCRFLPISLPSHLTHVSDLLVSNGDWNIPLLHRHFPQDIISEILSLPLLIIAELTLTFGSTPPRAITQSKPVIMLQKPPHT